MLAKLTPQQGDTPVSTTRVWQPLFCHALQPAQHFRGRAAKLQELKVWLESPVTADRVISVVAAGGTGKTALVHQGLQQAKLSDRAGVFVWSFYEDPHTDAFLRAAYLYFTGEKDTPTGGMLERLQIALSGDAPHLLILDALERVQSEGGPHPRGELEDLQLKRLVRELAGGIGNTRALVTSRFPLVDLDNWIDAGHRPIPLDDLERPVALEVVRGWGVKGDDAALGRLIEPLNIGGFYHALSVAVLGSYFANFPDAREFSIEDAADTDPKARRLSRILDQYAKALTSAERDLLARLSLFSRGVNVELLGWIVQSGGEVAGVLIGLTDHQPVKHLARLKALGLVFRYETDGQIVYSAHPFLREFFCGLLGATPKSVHESVRAKLAPSLESKPKAPPTDPAILDQYELLIEETLLAGRIREAFDLFSYGLGGYNNLARTLGENTRGRRILERFIPNDEFSIIHQQLSIREESSLATYVGLFALNLGDIGRARAALSYALEFDRFWSDDKEQSRDCHNLGVVEMDAGHIPEALEYSELALSLASEIQDATHINLCLYLRAAANFALGETAAAVADFQHAREQDCKPQYDLPIVQEAEYDALRGDSHGARRKAEANKETAVKLAWNHLVCRCDSLLARLLLTHDQAQAAKCLLDARDFANRSGHVDLQLRCFHSACELNRQLGDLPQSITEAEAGILLADTCGFGQFSIDLRLALAETYLAAGDAHKALQNARKALDLSEAPDCQYAWGKADGLHFCGVAHLRLGEHELARQRLTAALELRERLGHGRIDETRRALDLCRGK